MLIDFVDGYMRYSGNNPFGTQAKMLHHLEELYSFLKTGETNGPIFMEVNPTNRCNLNCSWCISENSRGSEEIAIDSLEMFFGNFKELGGKAITFSGGGEPTYYKHFERMVKSAKKEKLELGLMTSGVYRENYNSLIGKNFEWVRFSLDTLDEQNYEKHKGRNALPIVLKNINELKKYSVKVGINCNLGDNLSIEEVDKLVHWFLKEEPADYLQFRPILPRSFKQETYLVNEKAWNYLEAHRGKKGLAFSDDKLRDIKDRNAFPFRTCEGHYFEPILHATGEVKVCMYHPKDSRFTFGNIHEHSFKQIWKSKQRQEVIKFTRKFDYRKKCQFCCKLAELNKLIDFLKHPEEVTDINFL